MKLFLLYCPLKITLNILYNHYCENSEYTLSEHVKTVTKVSMFCVSTIVI